MRQPLGLTSEQVKKSRELYGTNQLTQQERETFWDKYIQNFSDPIIRILLVALVINIAFAATGHGEWVETFGILLAVILATVVSTYSEYSNENTFKKLQEEASRTYCKVWRDGQAQEVLIDELVTGDCIIIQSGDKIPVDGIMIEGDLKVDQAVLNGESKEAKKCIAPAGFDFDAEKVDFLDIHKLFRGSVVVEGEGVIQAVKIGDHTIYGQLTKELATEERDSPLKVKLQDLAKKISRFGYAGGILIAVALIFEAAIKYQAGFDAYFRNFPLLIHDVMQAVILAVVIIVMAVPEGLPLMIAIVSSLNMSKMLKDNVLVRKIVGIETAGSLNILFSDKTGTITKGQLEVVKLLDAEMNEYANLTDIPTKQRNITITNIYYNSSAKFSECGKVLGGNFTERALGNYICSSTDQMIDCTRTRMIPFNSADKYSMAVVQGDLNGAFIKGAPEKLVPMSSYYYNSNGEKMPLSEQTKADLETRMLEYADQAMRMLALCAYDSALDNDTLPESNLILIGILAIRDDVRPEAIEAIRIVKNAGVQVAMITGDRKETATAIAKDAGLITSDTDIVLTSSEMQDMSDEDLKRVLPNLRVVSRALPSDKSRLVRLAQELNLVVGMTGDGVNDAPALKKADVGFAMGTGTDVAKEASEIVILDDNFRSIEKAVLYGRTIYNSIRKFIVFQLTINVAAVSICFIGPFIGLDKPLTITQILWINLIMDTLAAMAFGGEPALEKYMEETPKRRDEKIVSPQMAREIFSSAAYMLLISLIFFKWNHIAWAFRTTTQEVMSIAPGSIHLYSAYFTMFTLMAVVNAFGVRTDDKNIFASVGQNPNFVRIMLLIVAVQIAMTFFGGSILRTAPLLLNEWVIVIALSLSIILVDVIRKITK